MESEDNGALTDCNRISILFSLKLFLSDYWSATNALLCEKSEKQLGTSSRDTQKAFSHKNTCKRLLKNLQHFVYFQSNGFFILIFILIFILLFYSHQRQNNGMTWFMSHDFGFFFLLMIPEHSWYSHKKTEKIIKIILKRLNVCTIKANNYSIFP